MDKSRLKIISLSNNKELAQTVAKTLNAEILPIKLVHFADNEILIEGQKSFRGDDVYIIQSTSAPANDHIMEVLLTIDACKRANANSITCVIPYFGYSRQDRKAKARQPISAKLVADLLTVAGANRIVCVDLHAAQISGFFNIPVDDVGAMPIFYNYFKQMNLEDIVCVSPDHGGVVRTSKFAEKMNAPLAIIDKRRPKPNEAEILGVIGDVKDKNCIIIDDIVDTAGTLCLAAAKLKELGAKKIYAAITHGVLSNNAVDKINNSSLEKVIITDSIPLPENKQSDKIEVLPLGELLAKIIEALQSGTSLSAVHQKFAEKNFK